MTSTSEKKKGRSLKTWVVGGVILTGVLALAGYIIFQTVLRPEPPLFAVPLDDAPTKGPSDALVTIVEFSDFQCPYCVRGAETVQKIFEESPGDVRIAFRHAPLPGHRQALPAAEASMAAHEQGKFWEFHNELFAHREELRERGSELIDEIAERLDLDLEQFHEAIRSHRYREQIREDRRLLMELGRSGVPTFYVNGRLLRGAQPLERFREVVNRERERSRGLLEQGVTREGLYRKLILQGRRPGESSAP